MSTSHERGHVAGLFYLAGAVVVLFAALDPAVNRSALLTIAATVGTIGVGSLLLASRFTRRWTHVLLVAASTLTAAGVVSGGGRLGPMIIVTIYMLIAMKAALLVSPTGLAAHMLWALTSMIGSASLRWPPPTVVVMVGVFVAAGGTITLVVSTLVHRLRQQATTDPLTGVANRAEFERALQRAQATVARSDEPLSLLLLDLDDFKDVNDEFGHAAGDDVLRRVTATWPQLLRSRDTLARLGGDEFAVILPGADLEAAHRTGDRLRNASAQTVGCSIGAAQWREGQSADELLATADTSLYQAKDVKSGSRTLPRTPQAS